MRRGTTMLLREILSEPRAVATDQETWIGIDCDRFQLYCMIRSLPLAVLTRSRTEIFFPTDSEGRWNRSFPQSALSRCDSSFTVVGPIDLMESVPGAIATGSAATDHPVATALGTDPVGISQISNLRFSIYNSQWLPLHLFPNTSNYIVTACGAATRSCAWNARSTPNVSSKMWALPIR